MATVYILMLSNSHFYIGSTDDFDRRLRQHQSGESPYTSKFLPLTVVFRQDFLTTFQARKAESWLKRMKSRSIIEQIIHDGYIRKSV